MCREQYCPPAHPPGIVSLVSLAFLSYERYCTMMAHTEADDTNYTKISAGIALSWGYSVVWTVPPLFGWSKYGPEGPGTTCSVNWAARDANSVSYILCLFLFCLVIPFSVIVYSYGRLLQAIKQVSEHMEHTTTLNRGGDKKSSGWLVPAHDWVGPESGYLGLIFALAHD